ncbi:polyphosphate kinase 1 [Arachidicoccus ginsenosidimutans]|uniref:polyphosphate kinase 1 n=1 Tax=Arachidicoccus sp. BS20 TaxID=1850526 RepID=UPI0009EEC0DA|nr:polyphosphate kinase 1 [Arachidicoccus sp. BS20]
MKSTPIIPRDISWLSFNERVLQEANDPSVPLKERIKFLAIHSNNLEEFFRVRVAALKRMVELKGKNTNFHFEEHPQAIIDQIQTIVLRQQNEFARIWEGIIKEMSKEKIFLRDIHELTRAQKNFVHKYFDEEVASNVIPLMIEDLPTLPYLRDKSLYLGVVMSRRKDVYEQKYALIEIPVHALGRFVILPSKPGEHDIILMEDVIRFNLPIIFSYFGYDTFDAHIFNVTKDAEFDIDNDISTTLVQKIEKGIKNRRKGKAVRFTYDKEMNAGILEYLIQKLNLTQKDNIIPGGKIHNFRHFMDFPNVFPTTKRTRKNTSFIHPELADSLRVTDVVLQKDVLLSFPYHSFVSVIDLLREAAMDPEVMSIRITAYRLASNSKIINALINAARNGKEVIVMMELRARFDEEANLEWKTRLEEEGVKVLIGIPDMKVHAKICVIKKRVNKKIIEYGFVATGNLNEKTARIYADHMLMTANKGVMADINKIFKFLTTGKPERVVDLNSCKKLFVCPTGMRTHLMDLIDYEIKEAKAKRPAEIIIKLNSISDDTLIRKIYEAAAAGVSVKMVVRGIYCAHSASKKFKKDIFAVSIVDEYLEHARVLIFFHSGKEKTFIASADWMVRNLDHRVEVAVEITNRHIKKELREIMNIQLSDNVKARILDNDLSNRYVQANGKKKIRSQIEIFNYLKQQAVTYRNNHHEPKRIKGVKVAENLESKAALLKEKVIN